MSSALVLVAAGRRDEGQGRVEVVGRPELLGLFGQSESGLTVHVPPAEDREVVHGIIYDELCLGVIRPESLAAYQGVVRRLASAGAKGVVLDVRRSSCS